MNPEGCRRTAAAALLAVMVVTAGCAAMTPRPQTSVYLQTGGGGFVFDRDKRQVYYGMTIAARKPLPMGSILEAQFENPSGGTPLVVTQSVGLGQTDFVLRSPPVEGSRAATNYSVRITLYSDASRNRVIDSYTQNIRGVLDQAGLGW